MIPAYRDSGSSSLNSNTVVIDKLEPKEQSRSWTSGSDDNFSLRHDTRYAELPSETVLFDAGKIGKNPDFGR
jgi:hypothetical protein